MKSIVYAVAGIAALGIMIALIVSPPTSQPSSTEASQVSTEHTVLAEPGSLTLEVPGMHCQFACYPHVKETLEQASGVSEVTLAEQPDPDVLTVKKVIVKYDAGFNLDAALASLKQEGFAEANLIQ
ncbi:heavy-metal-associated domain-containing protein [Aporhodopirellula aestuarii]|uniref:Heavy-metal-associated domain-containing protein n=1 Tax=Aporhodopirellula aestuarii TaxID=2950107 RepID=A0ABT0UGC0_9BACT|nr:heavy metal-associated domain-containing protein [Aporhodopirellula aestuarii]MCM2375071.1 heavy-metal-associated domain-containing protein [Aporhodopirellula aestuarii]